MMALPTIGAAAVTLLYESWSFIFIVLSPFLAATFNRTLTVPLERRGLTMSWTPQTRLRWLIIAGVVPGIYLVISSLSTGATIFDLRLSVDFALSIALVFLAALMTAIATSSKAVYGRHTLRGFYNRSPAAKNSYACPRPDAIERVEDISAIFAMRGDYLCMLVAAPLFLIVGLFQENTAILLSPREMVGIFLGTVIWIAAELCLQYSLQTTDDPSITTISHLGPVFTLVFLAVFSEILVYNWTELLVGGAILVGTNIVLHLPHEQTARPARPR